MRPVISILLIAVILGVAGLLVFGVVTEGWQFLSSVIESGELKYILTKILNPFEGSFGSEYGEEIASWLTNALGSLISSLLSSVTEVLTAFASAVPKILIFTAVTVISSVYFSADLEHINAAVKAVTPKKITSVLVNFKNNSLKVLLKYLKAYSVLCLISFTVMIMGFLFLRVDYALLIAFIVALLDMLPVIGVGTVLVPWSIFSFVTGDVRMGVGLLALFLANELIRQFAEPRILGKSLGIHPLVTLVVLYLGYSLLGVIGLLLLPVASVLINIFIVKNSAPEVE